MTPQVECDRPSAGVLLNVLPAETRLHRMPECSHLDPLDITEPTARVCPECVRMGSHWVHLRLCTKCGHIGCCDSSPNRHATHHFRSSGHPLARSIEPGESWVWCYVDEVIAAELDS